MIRTRKQRVEVNIVEYFNQVTSEYLFALKGKCRYKIRIELLSKAESVIGEVTRDLSLSNQGQITINYGNITRRSCTLTLVNLYGRYNPDQNSWFWVDRKFKLWVGVAYDNNIYWFAQGVYYTTDVSSDTHTVTINGVDKGGALDGTLKLNLTETQYVVEKGTTIFDVVRDTLLLNDGTGMLDPVPPLIDNWFKDVEIESDISISENEYLGNLLTQLAEQYGADVFYDADGRLNFVRLIDGQLIDGYMLMPSQYDFNDNNAHYSQSTLSYTYDYVNAVTVFTNINAQDANGDPIENVTYTAYNTNPQSPINIYNIRTRRLDSVEVNYINGLTKEEMTKRCKEYANYILLKQSLEKMAIQFSCSIVPHLDVNKIIKITDMHKDIFAEKFVVQEITMPLYAGEMSVNATNINMLPSDTNIERR